MLVNDIEINKDKVSEQDEFSKFVIKQACKVVIYLILLKLFYNLVKQSNHICLKGKMFVKMKDELIPLYY